MRGPGVLASASVPESSVVAPPSTSAVPIPPPTVPWPVTQHCTPGAGVWSFSGCDAVPTGSTRVQMPAVAVSPAAPAVKPPDAPSKSWLVTSVVPKPELATWNASGAPSGSVQVMPFDVSPLRYQRTLVPHGVAGICARYALPPCGIRSLVTKPEPVSTWIRAVPGTMLPVIVTWSVAPAGLTFAGAPPAIANWSSGVPTHHTNRPFSRSLPITTPLGKYG